MDFDSQSGHSIRCASPRGRDKGDEHITLGFAPPPGAINVAATPTHMPHYFLKLLHRAAMPIHMPDYFVKMHKAGTLTLHLW